MAVLRLCRNTRTAMIHKGAYVACQRHTLTLKAPLEQPALKLYLRSWQHVERRSMFAEGGTCTAEGLRWLVFGQLRKQIAHADPRIAMICTKHVCKSCSHWSWPCLSCIQAPGVRREEALPAVRLRSAMAAMVLPA